VDEGEGNRVPGSQQRSVSLDLPPWALTHGIHMRQSPLAVNGMLISFFFLRYTPSNRVGQGSGIPGSSHATYDPPKASTYAAGLTGTSSISHYDPYAPPRRPTGASVPVASSSNGVKAPRESSASFVMTFVMLSFCCCSHSFQGVTFFLH